eukprot:scaffold52535_cov21-Tisochrysis_lutea.AAC.1
MVHCLKAYAHRKFLTVNIRKSGVVHFNSRGENLPPFVYGVYEISPYSDTSRYLRLRMMFDENINLHYATKEALKPCLAGTACVCAFAHQHQIAHCLHAYLWPFKTYFIPAGMCACQIWATPYLQ